MNKFVIVLLLTLPYNIGKLGSRMRYRFQLPKTFPAPLPERHGSQFPAIVLLDTTLFPVLALLINFLLATNEIRCRRVDKLCLLQNLPDNKQDNSISVAEIAGDESLSAPGLELVETDEDERSGAQEQTEVSRPGIEGGHIVQCGVVEALCLAGAVPADEDDNHHGVGGDETGGGEVDEPEEDGDGGLASNEEGDAADEADSKNTVHGDTGLVALHEECRSLSIASKTVEGSRRRIQVGVSTG